jgi:hypothetical protein
LGIEFAEDFLVELDPVVTPDFIVGRQEVEVFVDLVRAEALRFPSVYVDQDRTVYGRDCLEEAVCLQVGDAAAYGHWFSFWNG